MDTEIKFAKMKKVLKMDGGEGCTTTFFFYPEINAKVEDTLNEWFGVEYELIET